MRFAEGMVKVLLGRSKLIVGLAFLMTVLSALVASKLTLEADLERLLPESAPSVRGMNQLQDAYGPIGRLTLVLDGTDETKLKSATTALGNRIRQIDGVKRTEFLKPNEFFERNRLLYIGLEDLETIRDRIKKRLRYEKKRANPLFVPLKKSEPPSVDFSDIEKKYVTAEGSDFFRSDDGRRYLVFVYFDFGPGNLTTSKGTISRIGELAQVVLREHPGVSLELTGRYKKRIDQTSMLEDDLRSATVLAFLLLLIFLAAYFRGFVAPLLITLPLLMGTVWAFAWAALIFGSLNILTGFFGAVILGLGIDYGIHLMSRYLEARRDGQMLSDALVATLSSAGRASVYAGLTTVVAFGSLAFSHFRAFHEYGIIALGGMTLIIIAQLFVLPAMIVLVAGTRFEPRAAEKLSLRKWGAMVSRSVKPVSMLVALLALIGFASFHVADIRFETDFQKIFSTSLPSWTLDEEVDEMLELSQVPAVILADDNDHAESLASEVRDRAKRLPQGRTIDRALTVADLLPSRQDEKLVVLRELQTEFEKVPARAKKQEVAELETEVDTLLANGSLNTGSLPVELSEPFKRIDDPGASVVLAFPAVEMHDANDMREFATIIRDLPAGESGVAIDAISEAMLMVDILDFVRSDSIVMLSITLFGLLLSALLAFRNTRRLLLLLLTIGVSIFVAVGMVDLFEISFNFINILIWPIWLGLGVDAAFHLMVRTEESPGDLAGFMSTLGAVAAAFGTSMIGFGSMLITDHQGLSSLGAVAVVGLASIFVCSALIQGFVFAGTLRRT